MSFLKFLICWSCRSQCWFGEYTIILGFLNEEMILQMSQQSSANRTITLRGQVRSIFWTALRIVKQVNLIIQLNEGSQLGDSWQNLWMNYYVVKFILQSVSSFFNQISHIMIGIFRPLFRPNFIKRIGFSFATFVVNNPTTGKPCVSFEKFEGEPEMKKQDLKMAEGRKKWAALTVNQRKQQLGVFVGALQQNRQQMITTIQNATGKHRQCAELEFQASTAVLKQDLRQKFPTATQKQYGLYYFKSFGNILVVCDYRMVLLACVKYLVACGVAGNSIILNPHRYGLPIGKQLEKIWRTSLPEYPLIYCPVNNYADGLEYLVHKKDMGFVSFSGDIEAGNQFYHFMAQKSSILAQSQFLLMSSDSAYVLKNLSDQKLKKAAENLSLACFIGGGNLFNSVKRIFLDEQIADKFTQYFLEASKVYKISAEGSKASPIITSGHITDTKQQIEALKAYKGSQLKLLSEIQTKQSYKSLYVSPLIYKVDGIATIEYWNKIYSMPICFIETVTSNQSAVEQINSSIYGISSTIYSSDKAKIQQIGSLLDVGVVYGNRWGFSPGTPYSPRKRSGKGFSFSASSFSNVTKSQSLKGFRELIQ